MDTFIYIEFISVLAICTIISVIATLHFKKTGWENKYKDMIRMSVFYGVATVVVAIVGR